MDAIKEQIAPRIKLLGTVQSKLEDIARQNDEIKLADWQAENQEDIDNDDSGILQKALEEQTLRNKKKDAASAIESKKLIDEIKKINDIPALNAWEGEEANVDAIDALNQADQDKVASAIQTKREELSARESKKLIDEIKKINDGPALTTWEQANVDAIAALNQADQDTVRAAIQTKHDGFAQPSQLRQLLDAIAAINDEPALTAWEGEQRNIDAIDALDAPDQVTVRAAIQTKHDGFAQPLQVQQLLDAIAAINDEPALTAWEADYNNLLSMSNLDNRGRTTVRNAIQAIRDGIQLTAPVLIVEIDGININDDLTVWEGEQRNIDAIDALDAPDQVTVRAAIVNRHRDLERQVGADNATAQDHIMFQRDTIRNILNDDDKNFIILNDDYEVIDMYSWNIHVMNNRITARDDLGADRVPIDATTHEGGLRVPIAPEESFTANANRPSLRDVLDAPYGNVNGLNWYWKCHEANNSYGFDNQDRTTKYFRLPNLKFSRYMIRLEDWIETNGDVPGTRVFRIQDEGGPDSSFIDRKLALYPAYFDVVSTHPCGIQKVTKPKILVEVPEANFPQIWSLSDIERAEIDRQNNQIRQDADTTNGCAARPAPEQVVCTDRLRLRQCIRSPVWRSDQHGRRGCLNTLEDEIAGRPDAIGGKKKKKKKKKILVKKIVRKHSGIIQTGGNKGRLRKGYKFTGKKLKSGLPQIIKCRINKF